eukprot:NODE_1065_length_1028_cov_91.628191_g1020_i0.p1 GENE.NODE_1065_length_1028_cov_91.628191_g1020_i0~~NODE_1065_length_1028_cov_91.628191_g1020_i0.p1  ORF type:complete len:292 (-),score=36.43 NODE_1065_length_1028_cov_91.628191_g1020_i0:91-966(-)
MQFGIIADIQYADKEDTVKPHKRVTYRTALEKLERAITGLNQHDNLAFVIHLGDIIDGNSTTEATDADLSKTLQELGKLRGDRPLYHVVGNHCLSVEPAKLFKKLGLNSPYYSFVQKNGPENDIEWRFIVLYGVEISKVQPEGTTNHKLALEWLAEHEEKFSWAKRWNGRMSDKQQQWLQDELSDARTKKQQVVVINHIPTVPCPGNERHLLFNHEEVASLISDYNDIVKLYLSGHYHPGSYQVHEKVHHITQEGIVECPEGSTVFARIELRRGEALLHGGGETQSRILTF